MLYAVCKSNIPTHSEIKNKSEHIQNILANNQIGLDGLIFIALIHK